MDPITLALANQYTADTAAGMGAVQGKPGPQGPVGPTGPQGPTGPAGPTGAQGEPGTNGVSPTVSVVPNSSNDGTIVTITDVNGAKSFEVLNGENGADGATGPQGAPGTPGVTGPAGPQGAQGIQGNPGKPFLIYKVYPTKADMDAGYATDGLQEGQLVGISTVTGGDDGGHLYIKGATAYEFFFDLSTVDGIAGPQGPQGIQGPTGPAGAVGPQGSPGAAGADGEDGFSPTVAVSEITGGHNVTITDASGPHSFDVMDGESGSETGENSFVTFKDQTITTPSELETAIGHRPYWGCIHAINTRILGMAFTNDIVWIAYQLVSGTYYLDLVTADGHCEAWSSASFSVTFSSISSTKFLTEDELDLANGTTFMGYFTTPPEANSTVSMHPDWFIGKKPTVGEQYRGKARNNVNKWWNMVVNVISTFDNDGTTMYTVEVVSVTGIGELPTGGAAGQILSKKTDADYDTQWIDAPQSGGTDLTAGDGLTITGGVASVDTPVRSILTQAEFDALPEAEQNSGVYFISGEVDGGDSGGSDESLDVYSTEEKRIGTWIDGKPLYRIVISATTPTSINTNENIASVSHLLIETLTNRRCIFVGSLGEQKVSPAVSTPTASKYMMDFDIYNGYIRAWTGANEYANRPAVYVLEYTKTTDQPEVTS